MNLENANRNITIAWIMTLLVGGSNIVLTIAYGMGGTIGDITWFNWFDLVFTFGMAFGIYKKSRIAAGIWLIYYLVTQLIIWLDSGVAGPPIFPIILLFLFFQGFRGTMAVHQQNEEPIDSPAA